MKTAAAARTSWAASQRQADAPPRATAYTTFRTPKLIAARTQALLLVVLAAAMLLCAALGGLVTHYNDLRQEGARYAALEAALAGLAPASGAGDAAQLDPAALRQIARTTGLADLRFDAEPAAGVGREVQSLQNGQGRIVGWFSWAPDRALIVAMYRLWGTVGALGIVLALCAALAARAAIRLARALSRSIETARKLLSEDGVTGLANQRVMLELLDRALLERGAGEVVLALIDLDGFGEVNDALGRAGGDAILVDIAGRLQAALPAGAALGRFEDDEFAVILGGADVLDTDALADIVRKALATPIVMEQAWQITTGVGVVRAPRDGATADELVRRAGLALRAAKRDGRGMARRFEPQIEIAHSERRFLLRELESAVFQRTLDVHYQPVVAAARGAMIGVEALLRWNHPTRGAIAPSVFIPLAEESGLMLQLGEFVLRRALADGARWPSLSVAVNLSPLQIRHPKLVELVRAVIAETGIAAGQVVLEMTEGILIDKPQETLEKLEALRALGVRLALDDFGTGYSSLSYLQKFPFQQLKIDRAFVAALGTTGNAGAIIQSIVTLGHALGMHVLAEGVETDEQRVLLRLAGCDEMQGFLFAKPRPADAIDAMLARSAGQGRATASTDGAAAS